MIYTYDDISLESLIKFLNEKPCCDHKPYTTFDDEWITLNCPVHGEYSCMGLTMNMRVWMKAPY